MNEEIKEMSKIELFLLDLKCSTEPTLTEKGKDLLLDYITNLQQENEKCDKEYSKLIYKYNKLLENKESWQRVATKNFNDSEDYKSRIDKAIEYIGDSSMIMEPHEITNLLDILKGESDE